HGEDASDLNLPLMIWYGIEPLVSANPERAAKLLGLAMIPLLRQYLARRIASLEDLPTVTAIQPLVTLLGRVDDSAIDLDILRGLDEALQGRREMEMPDGWHSVYRKLSRNSNSEVREKALLLAVLFGGEQALNAARKLVKDASATAT